MRSLVLLVALLFPALALADIFASTPNQAGGYVYLTTDQGICKKGQYTALATAPGGATVPGCWALYSGKVMLLLGGRMFLHSLEDYTAVAPAKPAKTHGKGANH